MAAWQVVGWPAAGWHAAGWIGRNRFAEHNHTFENGFVLFCFGHPWELIVPLGAPSELRMVLQGGPNTQVRTSQGLVSLTSLSLFQKARRPHVRTSWRRLSLTPGLGHVGETYNNHAGAGGHGKTVLISAEEKLQTRSRA